MIRKLLFVAASVAVTASAHANINSALERSVPLKDGTTVHVFADGKMGMEDRFGRAFVMPEGHVMQTADGKTIVMKGNEVWRVEALKGTYLGN